MPNEWMRGGQPPPDVARRVMDVMGDDVWRSLGERWSRVIAIDPNARLTQWYRNPSQIRTEFLRNPRAAWLTEHGVGLAVDVTPAAALRRAFIEQARREGFHVQTYASSPHVHVAAVSADEWRRSPLRAWLSSVLGPRPAR